MTGMRTIAAECEPLQTALGEVLPLDFEDAA